MRTTEHLYDLLCTETPDVHEQLAQIGRSERAAERKTVRARLDDPSHLEWIAECIDRSHERCAYISDLETKSSGDEAKFWASQYAEARATVAFWEAAARGEVDAPKRPAVVGITPARFEVGGHFDYDQDDEGDVELPEPELITAVDGLRRLTTIVSDARNWAWEPTGEWRITPSTTRTKHTVKKLETASGRKYEWSAPITTIVEPAKSRPVRTYPGQHIIGVREKPVKDPETGEMEVPFARQAIITFWSQRTQQWMIARCDEAYGKSRFTQWIPTELIRVPSGRPTTWEWNAETCEAVPKWAPAEADVNRPSLDEHSDRCNESLDLALEWAWKWASAVRREQASPRLTDGTSRAWLNDAQ